MKFLSPILLVALMGVIGSLPLQASEYVMEVSAKARMAKAAALTESGTTIGCKESQESKPHTADQQVEDAVAVLQTLRSEHQDGAGLPPELYELVMDYDEQVGSERLFKDYDSVFSARPAIKSNGEPVTITASYDVRVTDSKGEILWDFSNNGSNEITDNNTPYCLTLTRNAENNLLAIACFGNGELCTWNVENRALISTQQLDERCRSLALDNDNRLLGISQTPASDNKLDKNKILKIWDVATKKCIQQLPVGENSCAPVLAQDSDDTMVAIVGKRDGFIEIWDVKTGTRKSILRGHTELGVNWYTDEIKKLTKGNMRSIQALAVCKDRKNGHLLIASSAIHEFKRSDGLIFLWDAQTGECLKLINQKGLERLVGMDYNTDGELVLYFKQSDYDGRITMHYVHALKCIPGIYKQAHKEVLDTEKAGFIIQDAPEVVTHNGKELTQYGLPEALQRIIYGYAKPC